jgi:hypothetical protein
LKEGYLPPSVLSFWGIPQPVAGIPLLLGLLALAGWVFVRLGAAEGYKPAPGVLLGGAVAAALLLGAQIATTAHHAQDQGAQQHLCSVWLTPPHRAMHF